MSRRPTLFIALLAALFCLSACAGKTPSTAADADAETAQIRTPGEGDISVSEADGTIYAEIPRGTVTADLSSLAPAMSGSGSGRLHVTAAVSLKTLILPAGTVSATAEPPEDEPFSLDLLDASSADGLTQLVLYGGVRDVRVPDSLHTLVLYGGDLSGFAGCPSLTELSVLHPTDLAPLRDFPALGVLALFRAPEDGKWDLSPLIGKPLVILRLMAGITSEEAAALAGASVDTLQLSDAAVDDLAFLASMPGTKTLMLSVSSDQPPEIYASPSGPCGEDLIPLLNTPIPTEQLLEFAARGEIVVFTELNR